ncbi:FkbM family methyltransferase [Halobaculum sp. CBA1158]|uniref:FkbM family methyltransferase n=1 Tax=Halobaculum sp. CBA1158 TaxID=2904243 RepID=UPI001F022D81|nr:FkbM family methyltransferase [Halobaculum sp. CBA1158]UIP00998.1 FkbM family methyltransferase [Halobaculum sp. CBA1158]
MNMKRKASLAFHALSNFAGKAGCSKIPGANFVNDYLSDLISPTIDGEFTWINYEGHQLKIASGDHVSERLLKSGAYEGTIADLIHKKVNTGETVVDIGAHIGHHTLSMRAAAGETGTISAYEPHPRNAQYIRDTIKRNEFQNVSVIEGALSDTHGVGNLEVDEANTGSSSLHTNTKKNHSIVEVNILDADEEFESAGLSSIDFAKVDIQGGEFELIVGNNAILNTIGKMVIEIHPTSFLTPVQTKKVFERLDKEGQIESLSGQPISKKDIIHSRNDVCLYWESDG